jgi:hypothetical protein
MPSRFSDLPKDACQKQSTQEKAVQYPGELLAGVAHEDVPAGTIRDAHI